ncbi:MAG: sigma-70 family RNA polymerase sigma factor [Planctomycetota bacterium]
MRRDFQKGSPLFPTTRLSLVERIARQAPRDDREAWDQFYRRYAEPLIRASSRWFGVPPQEAEDIVQAFVAYLLEKPRLAGFETAKGRFRTFISTVFKRFLKDERVKAKAVKRGGRAVREGGLSEVLDSAPQGEADVWRLYEHEWAKAALAEAFERCDTVLEREARPVDREWFRRRYQECAKGKGARQTREQVARSLDLTEARARDVEKRVKDELRTCIEKQVRADMLPGDADPAALEAELRAGVQELLAALGGETRQR